jgi:hypothetical protein
MLSAFLLTSCLLLVFAMVGSLMALSVVRDRREAQTVPLEPADEPV